MRLITTKQSTHCHGNGEALVFSLLSFIITYAFSILSLYGGTWIFLMVLDSMPGHSEQYDQPGLSSCMLEFDFLLVGRY